MTMRLLSAICGAASAAVLLTASAASATVMIPLTVEKLTTRSDVVARGRVVAQQAAWGKKNRKIYTYTEIQVLSTVHGKAPQTIVVRSLGGEVGDIGMKVAGTPRFVEGEEVFMFLRVDPLDATQFQVVGMAQGKYSVQRNGPTAIAVPSMEGLAFVRPSPTGTMKVDDHQGPARRVPLTDLEARVKRALTAPDAPTAPNAPAAPSAPMVPVAPAAPAVIAQ